MRKTTREHERSTLYTRGEHGSTGGRRADDGRTTGSGVGGIPPGWGLSRGACPVSLCPVRRASERRLVSPRPQHPGREGYPAREKEREGEREGGHFRIQERKHSSTFRYLTVSSERPFQDKN